MTKKEMIQAMLDGRSFEHIIEQSVIYFDGETFRIKSDGAADSPFDINNYLRTSMLSYYKPIRTWEDDVREGKPVLCWVSNEYKDEKVVAAPIDKINVNAFKYVDTEGDGWKYATPVKPSECWGE